MKERITISQTSNADMNIGVHKTNNMTSKETAVQYMIRQLRYAYDAKKAMDSELDVDDVEYFGEIALKMEEEQTKQQLSLDKLKDKAEQAWEGCHGCNENDKQFWINGYVHGALEN